ncbi:unnamed protein product [Porites evermanni]|uniref:Uncharacterized protein n=2 Tax=Porites TaxID=46719 RepID=A0ABN8LQ56_9CNID|nr:unnamed protein product [Porites evermanni]
MHQAGRSTKDTKNNWEPSKAKEHSLEFGKKVTGATRITSSSTLHQSTTGLSTSDREGIPVGLLAGGIGGGLSVLILIATLFFLVRIKRRKTGGLIVAQSNTDTSFDNLGFTGGRKISEYMDLTDLELVRVKVSNSVKRKISAFTKEDQKTREVSCGRLDLVEVPANTDIDSDVLLTTWV